MLLVVISRHKHVARGKLNCWRTRTEADRYAQKLAHAGRQLACVMAISYLLFREAMPLQGFIYVPTSTSIYRSGDRACRVIVALCVERTKKKGLIECRGNTKQAMLRVFECAIRRVSGVTCMTYRYVLVAPSSNLLLCFHVEEMKTKTYASYSSSKPTIANQNTPSLLHRGTKEFRDIKENGVLPAKKTSLPGLGGWGLWGQGGTT